MLWSTIVVDTTLWDAAAASSEVLMRLIASSLERGGSHPLRIQVAVADHPDGRGVLEFLSRHAPRWRHFILWSELPSFDFIAAAKGNLPLLETLEISSQNEECTGSDVFLVAPRLCDVTFTGWAAKVPTLPWNQLERCKYINILPNDFVDSLALLPHFSTGTRCIFELAVLDILDPIDLPPISSNIPAFNLVLTVNSYWGTSDVLGAVLACLTLPCLDTLALVGELNEPPLHWNQDKFLSFASRSALHASLVELEIRATIQDYQLLQCLAGLPLLDALILSESHDHSNTFITDDLFAGLVRRSEDTCLVPRLTFLCLTSCLRFSESTFWEFAASRLVPDRPDDGLSQVKIYWLPNQIRELSPEFLDHGLELDARGDLAFLAGADPDYM